MANTSQIRIWQSTIDYITLDYATAQVRYSPQGERIRDRLGLVHRIVPSTSRYPTGLVLTLIPGELSKLNNAAASTRRSVVEWLELFFRTQAELLLYSSAETLDDEGNALTRNLAYRCYIERLPESHFASLAVLDNPGQMLEIKLLVTEDGTFSDFTTLASYSPYSPARP